MECTDRELELMCVLVCGQVWQISSMRAASPDALLRLVTLRLCVSCA